MKGRFQNCESMPREKKAGALESNANTATTIPDIQETRKSGFRSTHIEGAGWAISGASPCPARASGGRCHEVFGPM